MPNPLLSVRQKIQAVIPEIMELKFGCELEAPTSLIINDPQFEYSEKDSKTRLVVVDYDPGGLNGEDYDGDSVCIFAKDWGSYQELDSPNFNEPEQEEYIKILGRPISLADVLRAIGDSNKGGIYARADGKTVVFFKWKTFGVGKLHQVEPTYIEYDLSLDYDHQKTELYEFLDEILK